MELEYQIISEHREIAPKTMSDFSKVLESCISRFEENNEIIQGIKTKSLKMEHYHSLLKTLFYQVWVGPGTFALAGSMMDERKSVARDYLIHHAEEEKLHWTWIISDLRATGYKGSDPRETLPPVETQAYLSYATFLALRFPMGRLAMAAVLEGVSARFGEKYGREFAQLFQLRPEQMRFFLSHGALDQGHSQDIHEVISKLTLSGTEIAQLCHVMECTESMYKGMYNCSVRENRA